MKLVAGYCLSLIYALIGKRRRLLRYYEQRGTCLAIVGHDPRAKGLEKLLVWYLRHGFTFVLPWEDGLASKSGRLAWLSFDDGWKSFKTDVLPILEKLRIPATLFVAPHEIEQGQIWTNGTRRYLGSAKIAAMRKLAWAERQKIVDGIFARYGNPRQLLTKEEVVELSKNPLVDIQNHTMTHLSCRDRPIGEVLAEIHEANRVLKEWTGKVCKMVCYPFCFCTDETDRAIRALGFIPVHGDAGEGTLAAIGMTRNMFRDRATLQENIARSLNAWRKVVIPL